MSRRGRNVLGAFVAVLVVAALAVGLIQLPDYISRLTYAAETGRAQAAKEQLATANQLSQAFKNVVKAIRPSVVSINSIIRREIPDRGPRSNPQVPEEFRQFFGDDFFERFFEHRLPPGDREQRGLGTGVIISPDGHIVTNNHVVRGATELKVTLFNGRTYTAEVVGADAKTDLAVLKIDAQGLQPAEFADSDAVEVGEWVLAVGNPFELIDTVTAGIVSAKGRGVGITDYEDFIQTDAAINPGNSGGPMLDDQQRVVAVTCSKLDAAESVGFGIPVADVHAFIEGFRGQSEPFGLHCPACEEFIARATRHCPNCGTRLDEYDDCGDFFRSPDLQPVAEFVEAALRQAGINPVLARHGELNWSLYNGSALVRIYCCCPDHVNFSCRLVQPGRKGPRELFAWLLSHEHAPYFFDLDGSLIRFNLVVHMADVFTPAEHPVLIARVAEFLARADAADDILIERFGCRPAPDTVVERLDQPDHGA